MKISKIELKELFLVATAKNHFQFNGKMYDQIDGVAMGSPLAPALANLFLGYYENIWLNSEEGKKVILFKRYVDDIFCIMENENEANNFLLCLNEQHPNIRFTI